MMNNQGARPAARSRQPAARYAAGWLPFPGNLDVKYLDDEA
jgi:hypothetical protein